MSKSIIQKVQIILEVKPDGIWGPKSQNALNTQIKSTKGEGNPVLAKIQKILSADADGFWGPISQKAFNNALAADDGGNGGAGFKATASSFADPDDVAAFKKCKAQGRSDLACFAVGDNGIGQFGKITAQNHTAMVAIHKDDMIAKWGSVNGAAHRVVNVTIKGKTVQATVEDRLGVAGRIDLNPAAAKQLGLKPPFLEKNCVWSWA